ncbi:hypothetical protein [Mixta hanseatica]|uniref:Uncharacterized protein n=1 Tax=Mixta hanseatica TaxID=2872648 RepID=A0ABY4R9T3_9GAMM|nr:hypothetical protein [Mixta hanseatica]UQY44864.1 hypothetical protein K6958_04005 [Mixta hanseatica]
MNVSLYLKWQLLAERKIAQSLEKGIQQSLISAGKTLDDIYHGAERISWYSSCFIDKHHDVCRQLKSEDVRMIKALKELYKRKDVILDIFIYYIDYLFQQASHYLLQESVIKTSGLISDTVNDKATKYVLSYTLAKILLGSSDFHLTKRIRLNKNLYTGFSVFQFYGKVQKAAMAARRLKEIDYCFYKILYSKNIEMLYIYVEPVMSKIIDRVQEGSPITTEDLIKIVKGYK